MHTKNNDSYFTHTPELRMMVFASLFAALTAAGAYIQIPVPFSPVPVTLQVFFVLFAGSMLKSKWGGLSMIVYTLLGIAGLPVFAGGTSGMGVLLGNRRIYNRLHPGSLYNRKAEKVRSAGKSSFFVNALNMSTAIRYLCLRVYSIDACS